MLLKNIITQQKNQSSFIHVDATYKLICGNFSFIVLGTEDINHYFRLVALVLHQMKTQRPIVGFFPP
jgi:hypothetical protein